MNALWSRIGGPSTTAAHGRLRTDVVGAAAAFVSAAVLANLVQEFTAFEWSLWATQAILALSLTLVWGQGGIFSLGQAALYGMGGYTYGFWAINLADSTGETVTAVLAAVVVSSIVAALLGYFMFYGNVTDVYVAIITLATSLVLFAFVNSTSGAAYRIGDAPFGGYNGMTRIPRLTVRLPGIESHVLTRTQFFLVCVAAGLMVAVVIRVIARRPFGRIAVALQHNELRTELLGYDVRWNKLALFTIGGSIAGLAGALFAAWGRFISPPVFSLAPAALVVIWVLVGGRTSVAGAFVGVLVVKGFSSWFGGASGDNEPIVLGLLLIVIVLALPGGIVPSSGRALHWIRNRLALRPHQLAEEDAQTADSVMDGAVALADALSGTSEQPARLIAVRNVTRRFGGLAAVDDITLQFPSRGVSCLIGPNGAGKSTLLALLSGRLRPTSGAVTLDDHDLTGWHPYRRARSGVGIKLQVASIYKALTARENLWLAHYAKARDIESAHRRSADLLEWLELGNNAERPAGTLSHGQQQWLEIGMVVAGDPSIVLLDEPTAGMTRGETERTARLVSQLGERACVIVVEHDMEFVRQLDVPITVLHMGSVLAQGTFDELSNDERIIDIYLGGSQADAASQ